MNLRHTLALLAVLVLGLSGCAQQQPSESETAIPKLREQCQAGDNQACEKIAKIACEQGTRQTCRAECWPANVARACAEYRPEDTKPANPGQQMFQMTPY
jgi:hypothetical protein